MLEKMLVMAVIFVLPLVVLILFALMGALGRMGGESGKKATEILKIYAERGEQPPQSVIDALTIAVTSPPGMTPMPQTPKTRGEHFSDFARDVVIAAGAVGIAWWRAPGPGEEPRAFMILAVVVAVVFVATAVRHFVAALHSSDGK